MDINNGYEPTIPRPPATEIDRISRDLAAVLSEAGRDADGRRALGRDALGARLKTVGHSPAAIEWAVHLYCQSGLLRMSILKEKQVKTISPGVSEAKARIIEVSAVAATREFWERWHAGTLTTLSVAADNVDGRCPEGNRRSIEQVASVGDLHPILPIPPDPAAQGVRKPRPDLVLVTVNENETRAVHDAFLKATGIEGIPVPLEGRLYHNLGTINGTTVYHAISEMGSSGPGAMQQAVDKAIRAVDPGAIVAVGIA